MLLKPYEIIHYIYVCKMKTRVYLFSILVAIGSCKRDG